MTHIMYQLHDLGMMTDITYDDWGYDDWYHLPTIWLRFDDPYHLQTAPRHPSAMHSSVSLDSLTRGITYLRWPCGMTSVHQLTQLRHIGNMRSHVRRDSLTHGMTYVWWPWGMTSADVGTELRHTSSMRSHPLPIPKLPSACEPCCTRTNETCHKNEYGMSRMWMRHVT